MATTDYVTSANTVTDTSALDYLKCFQDALDGELDETGDIQRTLEALKGGAVRLAFAITFRVLRATRVAKYTFDLDPVSVERIDVLESKLRDQQEELERLRGDFDAGQALRFVQLEASRKNASTSNLLWGKAESDNLHVNEDDGEVKIFHPGVYSITAVVDSVPIDYNQAIRLMKNHECIQMAYVVRVSNRILSATLSAIVWLEKDDLLAVECDANVGSSYLTIVQLGR